MADDVKETALVTVPIAIPPRPTGDDPEPKTKVARLKDSKGRFLKKQSEEAIEKAEKKPKAQSTADYVERRRKFLEEKESPESEVSRQERIDLELFELVKLGQTDPKYATASVNAAKLLAERSHGRTQVSDQELEALKYSGITTVHIVAPNLMFPEVINGDKPKPSIVPSWVVEGKK